eukprot:scaffold64952_cov69-Phaeocystis_antarctica.AAC.2
MGLGCVSKGMRQQLYRLQPLVGVESLAVVQRPAHGPWRVTLLYDGTLAEAVVEQARQGRVRSISVASQKRGPYSKEAAPCGGPCGGEARGPGPAGRGLLAALSRSIVFEAEQHVGGVFQRGGGVQPNAALDATKELRAVGPVARAEAASAAEAGPCPQRSLDGWT